MISVEVTSDLGWDSSHHRPPRDRERFFIMLSYKNSEGKNVKLAFSYGTWPDYSHLLTIRNFLRDALKEKDS